MISRRFEKLGAAAFCAAIITSPIGLKIPLGPAALSPCDVLMVACAGLFLPSFLLALPGSWRPLRPTLPLLVAAVVSALAAGNWLSSARELAQLALYALCAAWAASRVVVLPGGARIIRAAAGLGAVVGIAAAALHVAGFRDATPAIAFAPWILAGVCLTLTPGAPKRRVFTLLSVSLVAALIFFNSSEKAGGPAPVPQLRSEIGQRWLEAYAAMTVTSRFPLLGLGPGNYQQHIGEYYGALPKANTMAADSQVGYGVVAASLGLLGLAGLFYWFATLARWMAESRPPAFALAAPLLIALAAGVFTPLFVSPMLAALALLHGVAWGRRTGHV